MEIRDGYMSSLPEKILKYNNEQKYDELKLLNNDNNSNKNN